MADAAVSTAGSVKLPGLGHVHKKTLMIGGLVGGGVLAYAYYRRAKNAGSSSGSAAASSTAAIDPQTGYPTGSPEDLAALQAQGSGTLDSGLGGSIDPVTGFEYGTEQDQQALQDEQGLGGGGGGTTGTTSPLTNSQWEQQALGDLEAGGVGQATITAAESGLPRYLAKLTLSADQVTAVQLCVGLAGPPPAGGPYSILAAPVPPTPPGGGTVTVPNVERMHAQDAVNALQKAGLVAHLNRGTPPGKTGTILSQTPGAGKKVAKGSTVDLNNGVT